VPGKVDFFCFFCATFLAGKKIQNEKNRKKKKKKKKKEKKKGDVHRQEKKKFLREDVK
jgi:hypothetical protein